LKRRKFLIKNKKCIKRTTRLKNCVLAKLLELKKTRKPTLKEILKIAISKMRHEMNNNSYKGKKKKNTDENSDEEDNDNESYKVIDQPAFFEDAADELHNYAKYHDRTVSKIFELADEF
jgi:hypothetical protein